MRKVLKVAVVLMATWATISPLTTLAQSTTLRDSDIVFGSDDAPLTVVQYFSSACPACAALQLRYFDQYKRDYIDSGLVRHAYREFLAGHTEVATESMMMARCIWEESGPDAYLAALNEMFESQSDWVRDPSLNILKDRLADAELMSARQHSECVEREELARVIDESTRHMMDEFSVYGVPVFLLDGEVWEISSPSAWQISRDLYLELDNRLNAKGVTEIGLTERTLERMADDVDRIAEQAERHEEILDQLPIE